MIGHTSLYQLFLSMKESQTLSHAYLLIGPEQIGKRTLVNEVAATLLETCVEKLSTHQDVRVIAREKNQKTGKLQKDIRIEQIRNIRSFAAAGPLLAPHNIVIIDDAQYLSKSAGNALLKTLEEPHAKTIIFLLVTDPQRLPATIISRCQSLYLHPVTDDVMAQSLQDLSLSNAEDIPSIVLAASGIPGKAIKFATDIDAWQQYQQDVQLFFSLFGKPLYQKRKDIDYLFEKKEDHIAGRQVIISLLDTWKMAIRQVLLGSNPQVSVDSLQAIEIYDTLRTVQLLLQKNVHPRAAIDSLLLTLP